MSKHSPAPWSRDGQLILDKDECVVAAFPTCPEEHQERMESDADLIINAPSLFRMLKMCHAWIEHDISELTKDIQPSLLALSARSIMVNRVLTNLGLEDYS